MNDSRNVSAGQFLLLVAMPFGIALAIMALLFISCGQNKQPDKPEPTVSVQNLQTAYGKEVQRHMLYSRLAHNAERERLKNVAKLFQAASRSEEIHATMHAALLRKLHTEPLTPSMDSVTIGTTLQSLKMAMSCEQLEYQSMYPNLIRTAELEAFPEGVAQFRVMEQVDGRHFELFNDAYEHGGKIPKTSYSVCPRCGYLLTSDQVEECPVCHAPKEQFERI